MSVSGASIIIIIIRSVNNSQLYIYVHYIHVSCTYMSTISMYYYQVFDFSGVYVHRAQSRHCTQWYLYFVSPLFQRRQNQQYFYLRWAGEQANCWQTLTWELRGAPISRIGEKSELQASRRAQNWGCTSEERSGGDNFGWTLRWLKKRIGSRWQNSSCLGTLVRVKLLTCFFPFLASRRYFSFWIELILWFYWEIISSHYFQASSISLFQALHGFQGYAGGLDTLTGQTGSHTFVTAYMGAKVCLIPIMSIFSF